jgi:hypothetical protein
VFDTKNSVESVHNISGITFTSSTHSQNLGKQNNLKDFGSRQNKGLLGR